MSRFDTDDYETRSQGSLWASLSRVVIGITFLAAIALVILMFIPKLNEQKEQTQRRDELAAKLDQAEEKLRRNQREVELLKNDPSYVETIARDRLDVMKEGETVLRFESPAPGPSAKKK